ncbi:MAG: homoserine dehydrogenase [Flavobacteriales bacterium]
MSTVKIGLFGFGCVGQGVYQLIDHLAITQFVIKKIAIKDNTKPRIVNADLLTNDVSEILNDPEIDLFVEVIDNADDAFRIVSTALKLGKPVITANKKMVATHLKELLKLEAEFGGILLYEAAVCGAIPIIRTLNGLFSFEQVNVVRGIFNGTSNFILSAIFNENLNYDLALKQAQDLGFAESNPESDVGGFDAKYKAVILAKHIFGVELSADSVVNLGIDNFTADDIRFAKNQGLKIKLIPQLITQNDRFAVYVLPHFVSRNDRLFHVENELNGVQIDAEYSGTHFFNGRGAGAFPTAFSILNDVNDATNKKGYAYKKSLGSKERIGDDEVLIEIYLRYRNDEVKKALNFSGIREGLLDDDYKYIIGNVTLASIAENKHLLIRDGASVIATGVVKFQKQFYLQDFNANEKKLEVVN